ncbi:uncharacterized protein LOC119988071 isoform X2 [Tripterygium wilfordii]|uniref:uncharacterized protein LOC119988071 isoform X2 n=1 Tax=Tripterygium wilfordii TaxID=458696 RepID=UPI0018F81148|nr:uncharacterized protein LOC119988071 isoform X2 [Tripterygium wilfordii]
MMRYQRLSPDGLPSSNGNKKPNLRTTTTCKQDINGDNGRTMPNRFLNSTDSFESKPFRFRSPSRTTQDVNGVVNGGLGSPSISDHHQEEHHPSPCRIGSGGGELLQWGIKKRGRVSRSEIRSQADDESSSSSAVNKVQVQRRVTEADKMPPPPPPPPPHQPSTVRVANPKTENPFFLPNNHRKLEARLATGNGSPSRSGYGSGVRNVSRSSAVGKRSPPAVEKLDKKMPYSRSGKEEKTNASTAQAGDETPAKSEQEAVVTNNTSSTGLEKKGSVEVIEWPRIYVSLSRKEKEEDFLAMKGTKLPHRPKKRAKNVDKTLQYCFPGMWLSDLTKSRYEVREKKSVKKKRRGLKGMGSMDSDSE